MAKLKKFRPAWYEESTPAGTWRSLFKWGDPAGFKHPNSGLVRLIMDRFNLTREELSTPRNLSLEQVQVDLPVTLDPAHIRFFERICGAENVLQDAYTRMHCSYGYGMIDALRLRNKIVENVADLVLTPRSTGEIQEIILYCDAQRIPVYVHGAGSTVTRGKEAVKGGISLDMSRHMRRVVEFNETDQTITVEAGMTGPQLEDLLNHAPEKLGAKRR